MASTPPPFVFVTGRQRTGTTVLRLLLAAHGCHDADEILSGELDRDDRFYQYLYTRVLQDKQLVVPLRHPGVFGDYLAFLRGRAGARPIVMDIKYDRYNLLTPGYRLARGESFVTDFMCRDGAPVLHVLRRNRLRAWVSHRIASRDGAWGAGRERAAPAAARPVEIDIQQMLQALDAMAREEERARRLLSAGSNVHEVVYEEMFDAAGNFAAPLLARVAALTGLPPVADHRPAHLRMNPGPLSALIANHAAVVAALRGTPHAWMAEE